MGSTRVTLKQDISCFYVTLSSVLVQIYFIYLTNLKRYNRRQYFIKDVQFVSQHITTSECLFITLK